MFHIRLITQNKPTPKANSVHHVRFICIPFAVEIMLWLCCYIYKRRLFQWIKSFDQTTNSKTYFFLTPVACSIFSFYSAKRWYIYIFIYFSFIKTWKYWCVLKHLTVNLGIGTWGTCFYCGYVQPFVPFWKRRDFQCVKP